MSKYRYNVKVKVWSEIEVEADSKEEAENKVWDAIDVGIDVDIGNYIPIWIEVSDVIVR